MHEKLLKVISKSCSWISPRFSHISRLFLTARGSAQLIKQNCRYKIIKRKFVRRVNDVPCIHSFINRTDKHLSRRHSTLFCITVGNVNALSLRTPLPVFLFLSFRFKIAFYRNALTCTYIYTLQHTIHSFNIATVCSFAGWKFKETNALFLYR